MEQILQEGAKDAVGSGLFTVVFVSLDGSALKKERQLWFLTSARHSISRADLYRFGDMKKQEVFAFLSKRDKLSVVLAYKEN